MASASFFLRCRSKFYCFSDQSLHAGCFFWHLIYKFPIASNSDMNGSHLLTLGHSSQDLPRDIRQQRIGEDIVHVARAALDFSTTAGYFVEEGLVIGQLDLVIFQDAALDLA